MQSQVGDHVAYECTYALTTEPALLIWEYIIVCNCVSELRYITLYSSGIYTCYPGLLVLYWNIVEGESAVLPSIHIVTEVSTESTRGTM